MISLEESTKRVIAALEGLRMEEATEVSDSHSLGYDTAARDFNAKIDAAIKQAGEDNHE